MDITHQVPGESGRCQVGISAHLPVIGLTEGNDVVVRRQNRTACQFPDPGIGFPLQHGLDLLRHDRSTEYPREGVAHGRLKLALDAVEVTHPPPALSP
jgi:hypothetical protein